MTSELAERFTKVTGSAYYLTADDPDTVEAYLLDRGYLIPGETIVAVVRAGEGNMNVTLRVITSRRRFILKQSRPWVAKFPELEAPVDRILIERQFHQAIMGDRFLSARMPEMLKADADNYVLLLEDLGPVGDMSTIYAQDAAMTRPQLATLLQFASKLHRLQPADFPANGVLKALNHAHIFDLPLRPDNGFPLDAIHPGLAAVALPYQRDENLRAVVANLGRVYLAPGKCLIHGDYYPGSFLEADHGVYVIDAEFAHLGRPEFDIGVLMAHLLLSRAPEKRILQIDMDYAKPPGFDSVLTRKFCYVEIIRRIIGIAQLPVSLTLDERSRLLERARAGLL